MRVNFVSDLDVDENQSPGHWARFTALVDFCQILDWGWTSFPIHVAKNPRSHRYCWKREDSYSHVFPAQCMPLQLSEALIQNELSPKHKVFLAFTIAKAFWQYYDSDWMKKTWSAETIQLLRTSSVESEAPFLRIDSLEPKQAEYNEYEPGLGADGIPHAHPYPYIFNLGQLLVQLGSIPSTTTTITANAANTTITKKYNNLCVLCCTAVVDNAWPPIESVSPAKVRSEYRRIVGECFPTSLPKTLFDKNLDAAGRRLALKDRVVRPLFNLYQDMVSREETESGLQGRTHADEPSVLQNNTAVAKSKRCAASSCWDYPANPFSATWHQLGWSVSSAPICTAT